MQHLARNSAPGQTLDFYFFDDKREFVDAVQSYFETYPHDKPGNIKLHSKHFCFYEELNEEVKKLYQEYMQLKNKVKWTLVSAAVSTALGAGVSAAVIGSSIPNFGVAAHIDVGALGTMNGPQVIAMTAGFCFIAGVLLFLVGHSLYERAITKNPDISYQTKDENKQTTLYTPLIPA